MDDFIVSTTTEEELSELRTTFPDFLHTTELISRTSAHDNIQEPSQHPSSGFISTSSILEETRYRSIEGRNKNDCHKTIQVFTQKEVHMELISNESLSDEDRSVNDTVQQSSQASTVKVESSSTTDHVTESQSRNEPKTFAESHKVTNQDILNDTRGQGALIFLHSWEREEKM